MIHNRGKLKLQVLILQHQERTIIKVLQEAKNTFIDY